MRRRELTYTLDNLVRMGPGQILARVWKKTYFRALAPLGHRLFPARVPPRTRERRRAKDASVSLGDARAYLEHVVRARPSRWLFDPADRAQLVDAARRHAAPELEGHLRAAERWARFEVDLLGYPTWQAEEPIDWTADPYGNREWTWSLVRLPFLEPLAKAYATTRDVRYARALRRWLESFWRGAPAGSEACFESYSIARRLLRASFCLFATFDSGIFDAEFAELFLSRMLGEAHKLRWHLEHENPTNHLALNYQALFTVGVLFPEYRPAAGWRSLGWRGFRRELQRQFFADHAHREQCTGYHLGMLEKLSETLWLARRQGLELEPAERERARGAFRFARGLARQDGTLPPLGDSPLRRYDEVGASGAAFFRDRGLLPPEGKLGEADAWRLSAHGLARLEALGPPHPPRASASPHRDVSGYRCHRGAGDSFHLVFDAGPIGHPRNPGHGHADALSLVLSVGPFAVLVDAGVGTYATGEWLTYYQSTRAHNTLTVDGRDQCAIWKGGRRKAHLPRVEAFAADDPVAELAWGGRHDGYARGAHGVVHERWVGVLANRWLLVWDRVEGSGTHRVDVHWHFAPGAVETGDDGSFRWTGDRSFAGRVLSSRRSGSRVACGERQPVQGFVATDFGRVVEAPVLIQTVAGEGPSWDALFVLALDGGEPPTVDRLAPERALLGAGDAVWTWAWPRGGTPHFDVRTPERVLPGAATFTEHVERLEA